MSDPRIESAKEALTKGAYDQVVQILKPLLGEMPDNMEIRSILTEAQEGMMLRLQLSQKLIKAEELLKANDAEGAKKAVYDVLKIDPTNPDAMRLKKIFDAPAVQDVTATVAFDMTEPVLDDSPFASQQSQEPMNLDSLEDFNIPLNDLQHHIPEPAFESAKNSETPFTADESFPPLEYLGGPPAPAEAAPVSFKPVEATHLSSDAVPFSLGGESGKVESYLNEGRDLITAGKYQEAVDVLTRVFILDEENQEAQQLIDEAKELDLNREREVNVILNEAISAYDLGNLDKAKELFGKVLKAFPGHREADYYLKEIEGKESGAGGFELEAAPSSGFELESSGDNFTFDASSASGSDDLASLVGHPAPPPPAAAPASGVEPASGQFKTPASVSKAKQKEGKRVPVGLITIVVAGLLVVSSLFIIGPMVWQKLFSPSPRAMSVPTKPAKPAGQADTTSKTQVPATPAAPQKSFSDLMSEAKTAMQEKQFDKAVNLLAEAEKLDKNNLEVKMALQNAKDALSKQQEELAKNQKFITDFEKASQYFKTQEYGEALRISWRLIYPDDTLAKQMGKADTIRKIIRNGYYNWGVKELKSGNPLAAKKNFQDLVDFAPDSKGKELLDFSRKYTPGTLDDKYRSYVQELSFRSLED
jgi:tetratricopeptide (TPR) repeat protein